MASGYSPLPTRATTLPSSSKTYAFAEHWTGYFNAKNLLDTPQKFYQGTFERVIQREYYGQTCQLGVRFDY